MNRAALGLLTFAFLISACRPLDYEGKFGTEGCYVQFFDPALSPFDNPIIAGGGQGLEGYQRCLGAIATGIRTELGR